MAKLKTIACSANTFASPEISKQSFKKYQNDTYSLFIFEIYLGCLKDRELGFVILDHARHARVGPLETAFGLVR